MNFEKTHDLQALRRLYEDRWRLYNKLSVIGYVPDVDMREELDNIKSELSARIVVISEQLMRTRVV